MLYSQFYNHKAQLTIEKIMQDPKISVGALPSNIVWSEDSKTIYFSWNPDLNKADSIYAAAVADKKPVKVSPEMRRALPSPFGDWHQGLFIFNRFAIISTHYSHK